MNPYTLAADLHTHTIASGHAADTIRTMAERALARGLEAVAVTDHGPGLQGGAGEVYFRALPRMVRGVDMPLRVIAGAEDDIVNRRGDLRLPGEVRRSLELVITGLHPHSWMAGQPETARTEGAVRAIQRGLVHVFAHPVSNYLSVEVEPVLQAAAASGRTALELNASKLADRPALIGYLERCAELEVPLVVNSDAHVAEEVGVFDRAVDLLREVGFPDGLVVNRSMESLCAFFRLGR
ncbi:MAG: PHP domain-containing protein [Spirochaetota bacterium]